VWNLLKGKNFGQGKNLYVYVSEVREM